MKAIQSARGTSRKALDLDDEIMILQSRLIVATALSYRGIARQLACLYCTRLNHCRAACCCSRTGQVQVAIEIDNTDAAPVFAVRGIDRFKP